MQNVKFYSILHITQIDSDLDIHSSAALIDLLKTNQNKANKPTTTYGKAPPRKGRSNTQNVAFMYRKSCELWKPIKKIANTRLLANANDKSIYRFMITRFMFQRFVKFYYVNTNSSLT